MDMDTDKIFYLLLKKNEIINLKQNLSSKIGFLFLSFFPMHSQQHRYNDEVNEIKSEVELKVCQESRLS